MPNHAYALVRDRVTAEEWPAIEVKGIRREIRPYALTEIFDEPEANQVINSEIEGKCDAAVAHRRRSGETAPLWIGVRRALSLRCR